jgi:hypothetical protein
VPAERSCRLSFSIFHLSFRNSRIGFEMEDDK